MVVTVGTTIGSELPMMESRSNLTSAVGRCEGECRVPTVSSLRTLPNVRAQTNRNPAGQRAVASNDTCGDGTPDAAQGLPPSVRLGVPVGSL